MQIHTRDFGEMTVDPAEIISFVQPVFGFEALRDFVLLYDDSVGNGFIWLQSAQSKEVCFILLDPGLLPSAYQPQLPDEALRQLELTRDEDAVVRVIAVIPEDFTQATVNLKSPVVINTRNHRAAQVMLEEDFPIRAPLVGEGARKEC